MAEHNTITDPEIHEPKGASTATAKQVYVSDGLGSGAWVTWPFGWGFYEQSGAGQVFNTTPSLVAINGLGSQTNETQLPQEIKGVSSLWDVSLNKITPVSLGDSYLLRLTLPIASKVGTPSIFTLDVDIGGLSSPSNVISSRGISTANTAPFNLQVAFPIFIGSTAIVNGVQIFGSTDSGSVTLGDGAEIFITRLYGPI